MMTVDEAIEVFKRAMETETPQQFGYQGMNRVVAPFMVGLTKDDRIVVQALQFAGSTSKGTVLKPEPRFFYLDTFDTDPEPSDKSWPSFDLRKTEYVPPKFVAQVLGLYQTEKTGESNGNG